MKPERLRLKTFIENNVPFYELKEVGFFAKDIRKTDYEKIAERFCFFLGLKSIYDYDRFGRQKKEEPYTVDYIDLISEPRNLN